MNENIALWIIQASITAAGLIFMVYTVVIPLLNSLLESRAKLCIKKADEISKIAKDDPRKLDEDAIYDLKGLMKLPKWLSWGLIGVFALYLISVLSSVWFLLGKLQSNLPLWVFLIATASFLIVGGFILYDVRKVMEDKFKELIETKKGEKPALF